jgi:hypothetical protein
MKLSNDTLNVLKNFASINQGIMFKKGKTIKTVSGGKNVLAEATISEEIPTDFGVYDLNNFLSVLSLHKEEPVLEFESNNVLISGLKGRSKIKYRFCAPHMIVVPPEKQINMPDAEISFDISAEDFDWVLRAANVLSSPNIVVESDGDKIYVSTIDILDDSKHNDSLEVSDGNGDKYRMIFKTENFKMLSGGYSVSISSKGISHFKHKTVNIQYWIATETGSTFTKA